MSYPQPKDSTTIPRPAQQDQVATCTARPELVIPVILPTTPGLFVVYLKGNGYLIVIYILYIYIHMYSIDMYSRKMRQILILGANSALLNQPTRVHYARIDIFKWDMFSRSQ